VKALADGARAGGLQF